MHETHGCTPPPWPAKRPRLLVVDDNSDDVFLLAYTAKRAGLSWDITYAPDWQAFQDGLSTAPDLVLVDFHLRGLELAEVVQTIRDSREGCPVVLVSGGDHPSVDAACRELGLELRTSKDDLHATLRILQRVLGERGSGTGTD